MYDQFKSPHKKNGKFRSSNRAHRVQYASLKRHEDGYNSRINNLVCLGLILSCCAFLLSLGPKQTHTYGPDESPNVSRDLPKASFIAPTDGGVHPQSEVRSQSSIPSHDKGKDTGHQQSVGSNHTTGSNSSSKSAKVITKVTKPQVSLVTKKDSNKVNIKALAKAVAKAESSSCTSKLAKKTNNCHSIMYWDKNGNRHLRRYKTPSESYVAFQTLWTDKYHGVLPTLKEAKIYTGGDKPKAWLNIVLSSYKEYNS